MAVRFSPIGGSVTADFSVSFLTLPALTATRNLCTVDLPSFGVASETRIPFECGAAYALCADFLGL